MTSQARGCLAAIFGIWNSGSQAGHSTNQANLPNEGDIHSGPGGYEGGSYAGGYAADYRAESYLDNDSGGFEGEQH